MSHAPRSSQKPGIYQEPSQMLMPLGISFGFMFLVALLIYLLA